MIKTTQLRIYTVREGLLDEWAEKWQKLILPLRLKFGFEIHGAWLDRKRNQFIWILSYAGPESFAERNDQYWASPERANMNLDPGEYLVETQVRDLEALL